MKQAFRMAFYILAVACAPGFAAEPSTREFEATQANAEDAAAREENDEHVFSDYSGKVSLFGSDRKDEADESGALGVFTTDKGIYLIKAQGEKVPDELKQFDGKVCTVSAKIRNEGKYIVIRRVILSGAEFIYKRRRGGM